MLTWPFITLFLSRFVFWYVIRASVMAPYRRPKTLNTPIRMALFSLVGYAITLAGIAGVLHSYGWIAAAIACLVVEYFLAFLRYRYIETAVANITKQLSNSVQNVAGVEFIPDECLVRQKAYETVEGWMRGKV